MPGPVVRIISYMALLMCLLCVNACGQKGDLYLPDESSLTEDLPIHHA